MKRRNKGFTLIELLAVIVILGLLMAIAIPSVTKYITQSRKKTVSTTIDNYMSALTNQVNDMEYTFTAVNTVYAVPIECIALERGGTNPFGEWHQSNNSYWAYVLVQYDDETSSYTYGFTFKDSAGYGLYPTTAEKLKESGSQILTDLDLTRPTNGTIGNITEKANWLGFNVNDDTNLVVLEATSEGETGNGQTTCTLCQKGNNYAQVEEDKKPIAQGTTGSLTWKLTKDYTLTISGNGNMPSYTSPSVVPWKVYKSQIKKVVIINGVTSIGNYACHSCSELVSVTIPSSVTSIGTQAFSYCRKLVTVTIPSSVTSIGHAAFSDNVSLITVYYKGTVLSVCASSAFNGCSLVNIHVPIDYSGNDFCGINVTK